MEHSKSVESLGQKTAFYGIALLGAFQIVAPLALLSIAPAASFTGFWITLLYGALLLTSAILWRASWRFGRLFCAATLAAWYGNHAWDLVSTSGAQQKGSLIFWGVVTLICTALMWRQGPHPAQTQSVER